MDAYNQRHANCMKHGEYAKGELVLVYDEALENQMSGKGALRWMERTICCCCKMTKWGICSTGIRQSHTEKPITWKWLKSYMPRQGLEPVIPPLNGYLMSMRLKKIC